MKILLDMILFLIQKKNLEGKNMVFFLGVLKGIRLKKSDLINSYCKYYGKNIRANCLEAKKINFIAFDNNGNNTTLFLENDDIGIYGDLKDAFFRKCDNNCFNIFEIVKERYKEKDINFLKELSGSFSFVLIDYLKQKVFLVRDQFGLKQLFWYKDSENIVFTNFLFSIRKFYCPNSISIEYLTKYYKNNGLLDFDMTPYKRVKRVKVSSYIIIDNWLSNYKIEEKQYWNLCELETEYSEINESKWVDKIDKLIEKSVKRRKKEKVGILLSGGLDSTTLYTYYADLKGINIESFSAIFNEVKSCDERKYIYEMDKNYSQKTFNYVVCDNAGPFQGFPEYDFYTSEPHVNIFGRMFSELLFAMAEEKGYKYLVDGFFADHIFNGSIYYMMDNIADRHFIKKLNAIKIYAQSRNRNIWKVLMAEIFPIRQNRMFEYSDLVLEENKNILSQARKYSNIDMLIQIKATIARNYGDFELAPRYGVECLHPYVDIELVEALYCIPGEYKCKNGVNKYILRKIATNRLPKRVVQREIKTDHLELMQKGIRDNWYNVYNILGQGRICKLGFLSLTNEKWRERLQCFRTGEKIDEEIWLLISMELWLYQIELKYGSIKFEE